MNSAGDKPTGGDSHEHRAGGVTPEDATEPISTVRLGVEQDQQCHEALGQIHVVAEVDASDQLQRCETTTVSRSHRMHIATPRCEVLAV